MRTLLTFTKLNRMRFLSHLDMIRLFRRAIRRAGIDIQYTEGFNPQQKMAVTNPLPLGYESRMELMMIETETALSDGKLIRLNRELPDGITVLTAQEPPENFRMHSHFTESVYAWKGLSSAETDRLLAAILQAMEAEVLLWRRDRIKKGKSRIRETDIRPLIHEAFIQDGILMTRLASFDANTLRPGDLAAFLMDTGVDVPAGIVFCRERQLA